jgi:hypothetical protein
MRKKNGGKRFRNEQEHELTVSNDELEGLAMAAIALTALTVIGGSCQRPGIVAPCVYNDD